MVLQLSFVCVFFLSEGRSDPATSSGKHEHMLHMKLRWDGDNLSFAQDGGGSSDCFVYLTSWSFSACPDNLSLQVLPPDWLIDWWGFSCLFTNMCDVFVGTRHLMSAWPVYKNPWKQNLFNAEYEHERVTFPLRRNNLIPTTPKVKTSAGRKACLISVWKDFYNYQWKH